MIAAQNETLKPRRRGLAQELQHRAQIGSAIDIVAEHDDEFRSRNARSILLDAAMCLDEFIITSVNVAHRVDRSEFAFGKR